MTSVPAAHPLPGPGSAAAEPGPARGPAVPRAVRLWERHPTTVDAVGAVLLLAVTAWVHSRVRPDWWELPLQAALTLPLAWRRRAPLAVFAVISLTAFGQWLAIALGHLEAIPADFAVLIALYTVAARCSMRWTLAAYLAAELGVLLIAIVNAPPPNAPPLLSPDPLSVFLRVVFFLSGATTAAALLGLNSRARQAKLAALHERARELEGQRDQQAALAVAQERSRIAREMHDIVTHNLSVMVALADGAVYASEHAPDKATAAMRQSAETGRQALTDMRRFLGVLRADEPDALRHPQPGLGALDGLVAQVRAAGLPCELTLTGSPAGISPGAQLTVYRLVQESLTNTLKHSAPGARATVAVACGPGTVRVEVRDDGRAAAAAAGPGGGHGLAGMRERVAAYGGELSAGPLPGGGWRVAATLDLDPDRLEALR
ncbi:two-component sensor histidine kinase [Streptomyces tateyamensis]|uniref:histidine kinase n=1 Tax=Streptomyces tateyamensis TaxID=565073 RepID=A0A2V4NDQ4_9ACTN|nr:histidine kinase [Streptomyces tateyamensis]PYC77307.1 two-component sensor histidine kinase [Streptomyces tateyamensis]